jgi:hypothetical protein
MEHITVEWANESKTLILVTYHTDTWGWDELLESFNQQKQLIDSVAHPKVDILVDVRSSHLLPKGVSLLSGVRRLTSERHPRQGHTVIIGAHGLIAVILKAVEKLLGEYRQEMHVVDTVNEAHLLIARIVEQRAKSARVA